MTAFTDTWNSTYLTLPADSEAAKLGAGRIRDLKNDITQRMVVDHSWAGDANDGAHIHATLIEQSSDPTYAVDTGFIYTKAIAGNTELFYMDETGAIIQLTSGGKVIITASDLKAIILAAPVKATPVAGDIFALLDSASSNALSQTTWGDLLTVLEANTGTWALNTTGNAATAIDSSTADQADLANDLTGAPAFFAPITAHISLDVNMTNSNTFYDGPSIAQGSVGKWIVGGKVSIGANIGDHIVIKLWDGTTVIDSGVVIVESLNVIISFYGYISAPAGNLKITVKNSTSGGTLILSNSSGLGRDSTITAHRVG